MRRKGNNKARKAQVPQCITLPRVAYAPRAKRLSLSQESPLYEGEGVSGATLVSVSLATFFGDDLSQRWEKFRFKWIEVYARYNPPTIPSERLIQLAPIDIFSSYDPDTFVENPEDTWVQFCRRNNVRRTWVSNINPVAKIARFQPRGMFPTTTGTANAGNVVPGKNTWFDADAANQLFGSLHVWAQTNKYNIAAQSEFSVDLILRAKIEFCQPI